MELFRTLGLEELPKLDSDAYKKARTVMHTVALAEDRLLYQAIQTYIGESRAAAIPLRWMFTHVGEDGKTFYTYHDETPENDYRFAYRDTCVAVTPLYEGVPDPWKDAITDACTVCGIDWHEGDPRRTLTRLVAWHTRLAVDPMFSVAARQLQAGGPAREPEDILAPLKAVMDNFDASALIRDPDNTQYPEIGSTWVHHSGNEYTVLIITNKDSDRPKFPTTVVYRAIDGKTYSRPFSEWAGSFTLKTKGAS